MNRYSDKIYQLIKAMTVTVFASFVCWALAQPVNRTPPSDANQKQLDHLDKLMARKKKDAARLLADSLLVEFKSNNSREDWYQVLRRKTVLQNTEEDRSGMLEQLRAIVSAETLHDSITASIYGLLGFLSLYTEEYEMATWYYERNLAGLLANDCKTSIGTVYMNMGYSLKEQNDFRTAISYYLASIPLLKKEGNKENLYQSYVNLGDISRYINEFDQARQYYKAALDLSPEDIGSYYANLGWVESNEGHHRNALAYFKKAYDYGEYSAEEARIMGACEEALGDTMQANKHFKAALQLVETSKDSSIVHSYIANALLKRGQLEGSLQVCQLALQGFYPELSSEHLWENPQNDSTPDFWAVQLLSGKAKAFYQLYHLNKQRTDYLRFAFDAASAAATALDRLQGNMSDESGQDAVAYAYSTYELGIMIALEMQHVDPGHVAIEAAYNILERARSRILKISMSEKELRMSSNIPDSLQSAENQALADKVYWEGHNNHDSLFAAERRLEKIKTNIYEIAPVLKKIRSQFQDIPVADIRNSLQPDELLLQYFWGDSTVVVFAVTRQSVRAHLIPGSRALELSIDTLQKALLNWHMSPEAYAAFALPVYRQFCAPLLENAGTVHRLFIVPDGRLWTLPFEALCTTSEGRFLMEDYTVSYHWSGALWRQSRLESDNAAQVSEYGGFAPEYSASAGLATNMGGSFGDLPEARAAVEAAGLKWNGKVYTGSHVNKALFQQEAGKYGILHLAMHGQLELKDRTRTGLVFPAPGDSVSILNILEISQMNLSARLAVLSACNTARGVIFRGEGVMSLSRAFALAGCPAITANLWEVPSQETNLITESFLSLLQDGESKDEALRNAKLRFLENAESERRHPYFWAAQVLIGNERPLVDSWWRKWYWVVLVLLIVGGGVVAYRGYGPSSKVSV